MGTGSMPHSKGNQVLTNVPKRVKRASGVTFYSRQRQCLAQGSRQQEYKKLVDDAASAVCVKSSIISPTISSSREQGAKTERETKSAQIKYSNSQ